MSDVDRGRRPVVLISSKPDENVRADSFQFAAECIKAREVALVINTPDVEGTADSFSIRRTAHPALKGRVHDGHAASYCMTIAGRAGGGGGHPRAEDAAVYGESAAGLPPEVIS